MTKIVENVNQTDVQLHIKEACKLINDHLPVQYVDKVLQKLPGDSTVTASMIRNIRAKISDPTKKSTIKLENYLPVIVALATIAKSNRDDKLALAAAVT